MNVKKINEHRHKSPIVHSVPPARSIVNHQLNNRFRQHQHFIPEYLHYPAIDAEYLTARGGTFDHHIAHAERADERCVVVEHLKLPFGTRKRYGAGFPGEYFLIGCYDFKIHL